MSRKSPEGFGVSLGQEVVVGDVEDESLEAVISEIVEGIGDLKNSGPGTEDALVEKVIASRKVWRLGEVPRVTSMVLGLDVGATRELLKKTENGYSYFVGCVGVDDGKNRGLEVNVEGGCLECGFVGISDDEERALLEEMDELRIDTAILVALVMSNVGEVSGY